MPAHSTVATLSQWQEFACEDPAEAAREVARRIETRLSPAQTNAVFSDVSPLDALTADFRAGTAVRSGIAGVPFVLKDLFYTERFPLRAGSGFPPDILPQRRADGVLPARLRSLGGVLAGTTHLHEFAYGLTGQNAFHGDVQHPKHAQRTSGGSSSGSAVAVAKGIVPFAIGTDTGGSIRVPAAFCGIHGLRLQPMDTLIQDAFPLSHRFDTAGWFATSAEDLATVTKAILGPTDVGGRGKGVFLDFTQLGIEGDGEMTKTYELAAREEAEPATAALAHAAREAFAGASETYAILQSTDAYSVHREWLDEYRPHYSAEVWQRIDRGRRWDASQLEKAQRGLETVRGFWREVYQEFDYVVLPASPFPALEHAACTPENRNLLLALNTPASLAGLPVRTRPFVLPSGLTGGLQIVAPDCRSPVLQGG